MNEIDINKLNKGKSYCNICLKQGILTVLEDDENDSNLFKPPSCKHNVGNCNYYRYSYIHPWL